jgi:hypothetical protein
LIGNIDGGERSVFDQSRRQTRANDTGQYQTTGELGQPIVIEPATGEVDGHEGDRRTEVYNDEEFDEAALEPET